MDDLLKQLHVETCSLYHYDALFTSSMKKASRTCIWLDSEWSKVCFTLIRMSWDHGIERSLHIRAMQRRGMIQWCIWDPGKFCSDRGGVLAREDACSGIA